MRRILFKILKGLGFPAKTRTKKERQLEAGLSALAESKKRAAVDFEAWKQSFIDRPVTDERDMRLDVMHTFVPFLGDDEKKEFERVLIAQRDGAHKNDS